MPGIQQMLLIRECPLQTLEFPKSVMIELKDAVADLMVQVFEAEMSEESETLKEVDNENDF